MTTLAFDGGGPRQLLARLLDTPDLAQVVPSLDPKILQQLVRHVGLEECGAIVALATAQQLTQIFDEDLWRSDLPGQEEQLDADRFGLWLEVLADAGDGIAAQKLVAMDFDFVTAAVSRQVFVLDQESMMEARAAAEYAQFGDYDLVREALEQRSLDEDRESCEFGGYTVIAKHSESWDALLSLLTSLDHDHPVFFGRLMQRCSQISTEWIVDNGGPYEVLTSDEQVMADAAGAREERREQQGYVTPLEARAFLKFARTRHAVDAPVDLEPQAHDSLLPATSSSGGERLSRIRTQLLFAQEHGSAAHQRCTEELAYLANVLVAGCSFQSRRFRANEAADAVLAVCNLGLENSGSHQNLVSVFRIGWRILYEDVCLHAAKCLVEALSDLRCDDRHIQSLITTLYRNMKTQVEAGTPWLERENLDAIAILDQPSWALLVNLIDECPIVPRNACTPDEKPSLRVTTEFGFISENRQIAWARDFAESLAEKLY
jgi:hypothetical protein